MKDSEWKVWLQENKLTQEDNYYAEISTAGKTAYTEDIAQAIKAAGSELQLETLVDVLNHADRVRRDKATACRPALRAWRPASAACGRATTARSTRRGTRSVLT